MTYIGFLFVSRLLVAVLSKPKVSNLDNFVLSQQDITSCQVSVNVLQCKNMVTQSYYIGYKSGCIKKVFKGFDYLLEMRHFIEIRKSQNLIISAFFVLYCCIWPHYLKV